MTKIEPHKFSFDKKYLEDGQLSQSDQQSNPIIVRYFDKGKRIEKNDYYFRMKHKLDTSKFYIRLG